MSETRYENLPVYKKALDVAIYFESVVRGFDKYHKYTVGTDLRNLSRRILVLVAKANIRETRKVCLVEVVDKLEELKITIRLCKEIKAFRSFKSFEFASKSVIEVAKQCEGWLEFSPIEYYIRELNLMPCLKEFVCSSILKCHKFMRSVIIFFSKMMNNLYGGKVSSYLLFNNKAMCQYIPSIVLIGVFGASYKDISFSVMSNTVIPTRVVLAFDTFAYFCFCIGAMGLSLVPSAVLTARVHRTFLKSLYSFRHKYLRIKEAAFGGLSETVRFLHLLTAKISDIKSPPLISTYSISQMRGLSI